MEILNLDLLTLAEEPLQNKIIYKLIDFLKLFIIEQ